MATRQSARVRIVVIRVEALAAGVALAAGPSESLVEADARFSNFSLHACRETLST